MVEPGEGCAVCQSTFTCCSTARAPLLQAAVGGELRLLSQIEAAESDTGCLQRSSRSLSGAEVQLRAARPSSRLSCTDVAAPAPSSPGTCWTEAEWARAVPARGHTQEGIEGARKSWILGRLSEGKDRTGRVPKTLSVGRRSSLHL